MFNSFRCFALSAATLLSMPVQAQLYGGSPFQNEFYQLDIDSGAAITTTPVTVPTRTITGINGVTIDPTTGIAYAIVKATAVTGRLLIRIDLATAVGVEIGNLGDNFSSLTFRGDGQLFGTTGNGATVPETLYLIDKTNATKVLAASLGNGADGEIIAFNPDDGLLYHWSGNGTVFFESILATAPYTVTNIPITGGPTAGETFGAVWDECRNVFITSNISSSYATVTPAGVYSPAFGTAPDDIRGMALVGRNTCNVYLSTAITVTPSTPANGAPVTIDFVVSNAGFARALAPTVTLTLPANLTGVTSTGCAESPAGTTVCTLPTIFGGANRSFSVQGTFTGGSGTISSAVSTTSVDTVAGNNSSSAPLGVVSAFAISPATIAEGTGGTNNLVFTVTASPAPASAQTVQFASSNGTAIAGTDYTLSTGTLTFNAGVASQTITVPLTTDTTVEGDETLTMTLSNPVGGATISTATATGTISNDDSSVISVNTPNVAEGNVGNTPLPFSVSLSNPVQGAVSFTYTAANGNNVNPLLNATLADNDFLASTGSVSFPSDSSAPLTVNVPIVGDLDVESNQGLLLNLSNLVLPGTISPASVTFAASGAGTINNDDGTVLSIANAAITEGNAGSSNLVFNVSLSASNKDPVTVQYASADGTATAGSDYTVTNGTLTFPAFSVSQTITVPIAGENIVEANEAFTVTLSAPIGATLGASVATGTINNDDSATLSLNSVNQAEGNSGNTPMTFTATLSNPVQGSVGATLNTGDGNSATVLQNATAADNDYVAITNSAFTLASGLTQTVPVQIVGDTDVEPNQGFRLILSNLTAPAGIPAGAITLGTATGNGTINNDDSTSLNIAAATLIEGNTGTSIMNLTVSLPAPNKDPVTVNFATSDGTATAGVDYVARTGTLTFPSNVQSQQIAITINGDVLFENNETFTVTLSAPSGATIGTASAIGTITDDEVLGLSIADATIAESAGGSTVPMNFTVALAGASSLPVTVNFASNNGTATAPNDFTAVSGTLTFAPGESSKTIAVSIFGDNIVENNETFAITLSNPNPAPPRLLLTRAVATGTIGNDDVFIQVPALDWRGLMALMFAMGLLGMFFNRRN